MSAEAIALARRHWADGLAPDPRLSVSEWADQFRMVSAKSAEPGRWRTQRTPYLREIMDSLSPRSPVELTVLMKGAQIGGTEALNNFIGYVIDLAPGPIMIVQPTVEIARRYSKQKIDPMIASTPRLTAKVREPRARDSGNTTFSKDFPGGPLVMTGANSAVGLRSMAVRYLLLDEVDGYPGDVEGEGDPVDLARARTRTFSRRKIALVSTPTIEGRSRIAAAFAATDQRFFHVPCPKCGHRQPLSWKQMRWEKKKPESAMYICEACQFAIGEEHKGAMLAQGVWVAHASCEGKTRGYHLSSLYSPPGWYSWSTAVAEWEGAQKHPDKLRVFVNTVLGEVWQERGDAPEWEMIYRRRETYEIGVVPERALVLTAGVDVQKDRIEVEIVGWGRDLESWSIEYLVLDGATSDEKVWTELEKLYSRTWRHERGALLAVRMFAIDSGYQTQTVYNWARKRPADRTMVIKGSPLPILVGIPSVVDVSQRGKKLRRGCRLWPVGVGLIKGELYSWLRSTPPLNATDPFPPGWCHFPQYSEDYFKQLTAEELVTHIVKGYRKTEWQKKPGQERNEALDCRVYARAAAALIGLDRYAEEHWLEIETHLKAVVAHAEDSSSEKAETSSAQPSFWRRRPGSFWNRDS
jgi:phage terminase large subunit GpA-like protein